jgi:hypothetical protein
VESVDGSSISRLRSSGGAANLSETRVPAPLEAMSNLPPMVREKPSQQVEAEAPAFHGIAHADAIVLDEQAEVVAFAREVDENDAGFLVGECVQVGPHKWKSVFDETIDPVWFLSASQEGYFRLMALSVSRKITDRCPDRSGSACDYLLYWKHGRWVWDRIR